jgi:regulator of sigma E protease
MIGKDDPVEFVIAAIPLGGYVKPLDERDGDVPPADVHRSINRQPVWKRILFLLGGATFNFAFAIGVYWILFVAGVTAIRPIVGEIKADSIAAQAGMRYEDEIVAVSGRKVSTIDAALLGIVDDLVDDGSISMNVRGVDGGERALTLHAGEKSRELTQPDALLPGLGFDLWQPRFPAVIGTVVPDSAAEKAGLQKGDRVVRFDGRTVTHFTGLTGPIEPSAGRRVILDIERNGSMIELPVTIGENVRNERRIGWLGVGPDVAQTPIHTGRTMQDLRTFEQYPVAEALKQAAVKTWDNSIFTLRILGRTVTGDVSLKVFSGPIGIAESTGAAVRLGWRMYLSLIAVISISLGVLNLMPIPILDGGQIVYQLAELVKGRPVSERAQLLGQQIGIAMLILMMTLAFYNDIARHLN